MEYLRITEGTEDLKQLQIRYKEAIREDLPSGEDFERLSGAIRDGSILFYGCSDNGKLIACCSVSRTFSTFNYLPGGAFEDFYIEPEYRHRGIARELARFAFRESAVASMTVGCADCDREMYTAIGFRIVLGNLLAYDE